MNKFDMKYIFRRVLTFFIIFVLLSFFKSCEVHAETYNATANTTIAGYNLPGWWQFTTSTRNLLLKYNDWQYYLAPDGMNATFGYLTTCATGPFTVNNVSADCSDGCFNNDFHVVNVGANCTVHAGNNTYNGKMYYIFYSVKTIGWTNADTLPIVYDTLTFKSVSGSITTEFLDNFLSTDDLYVNYVTSERLDELVTATEQQTSSIINNNNTNTNNIINNNNTNTQNIIDNQNANANVCYSSLALNWNNNGAYDDNGNFVNSTSQKYTGLIYVHGGGTLTLSNVESGNYGRLIALDKDKNYLDWYSVGNRSITLGNSIYYIKLSSQDNNINLTLSNEICVNRNEQLNNNIENVNDNINKVHDTLTDTSSPSLSALNNSAGWLPPGPVDSILNLPLSLLNNLSSNLSKSCQPVVLPIPFINSNLTLPCVKTLYHDMGIDTFINWVGGIASAFILLAYLLKLYKWVDDTLTFRENHQIDNWGGI